MVDTQYINEVIKNSGKKKSYLADKIGCSRQSFSAKLRNRSQFTTDNVAILCNELNISKLTDKEKIFFTK